jgi:hypothetical protein
MLKLAPTKYEPKWVDHRIIWKVNKVLAWCEFSLDDTPRSFHSTTIRKVFGTKQTMPLTKYLMANLLIRSGNYEVGGKGFDYSLNRHGFDKIKSKLSIGPQPTNYYVDTLVPAHLEAQAKALDFKYNLKSDRYWNGLQNIKRDKKYDFWCAHGLPFNYDIEACAPTILLGLATNYGLNHLVGQPINDYLSNKEPLRCRLAALLDIDYQDAKHLINSLFNGARLAATPYCAAYRLIGSKMQLLQADPEVRLLRVAIKSMWTLIGRKSRTSVRQSKGKWALYFNYERQVLDIITAALREQNIKFFTEHDGFRTNLAVNTSAIEQVIRDQMKLFVTINIKDNS